MGRLAGSSLGLEVSRCGAAGGGVMGRGMAMEARGWSLDDPRAAAGRRLESRMKAGIADRSWLREPLPVAARSLAGCCGRADSGAGIADRG
jgi:hypothetical protein